MLFIIATDFYQSCLLFIVIRYMPRRLWKMATDLHLPSPIKIQMATLILRRFQYREKKMVAAISQRSLSPLENKAALWEIQDHPMKGVNGIPEKNGPPLKAFLYSLIIKEFLGYLKAWGESPFSPNTKENLWDHLIRGRVPHESRKPKLLTKLGFPAVPPPLQCAGSANVTHYSF